MKIKGSALYVRFFCWLVFSLCAVKLGAQKLDSTLAIYADKFAEERAYLHYDKASYLPGETVWFKAYLMQGIYPANSSKTLYVDWIDDNGNLLVHLVSPVVDATTNGQFEIPETYTSSTLHVRAYTKWMLNFDTAFVYSKDIPVVTKPVATPGTKTVPAATLEFFPEGGDAVAGILNKIAFKANDQWGNPVAVKGVIQTGNGAVIDSFHAVHDGMGYVLLTPQANAVYIAQWTDGKGVKHSTSLPAIKSDGVTMQVFVTGSKRQFTITRTENAPDNLKQLHLIGTMNGQPVFKASVSLEKVAAIRGNIPTADLPTGVVTITLFDAQWNAIAERITFVNNEEFRFQPELEVQEWGLHPRAHNEIELTIPDSLQASLSVAVTDADIERDSSDNIITRLLLTGELKGKVYHPAYYFSSTSDTVSQNLDLVMLTHGWRRFKWEDVAKGKLPVIKYPRDSTYLTLSGKVYGMQPGELRNAGNVILIIKQKDSAGQMLIEPVDPDGTFNDPSFIFFDTLHVYYQLQKAKGFRGTEMNFMPNRLPAPNYAQVKNLFTSHSIFDTLGNYRHYQLTQEQLRLAALQRGKILENVTVTAKVKPPLQVMDEKYASGLFRSGDAYQFDLVNDVTSASWPNIFQYLQGKVAGLQISANGSSTSLTWRGGAPQLYLDEMQVDVDMLSNIPVSDVAYVKVLRPPFFGGFGGGANGAIAVYTRRGGDVVNKPDKGLNSNTISGYTPVKQFYSPNYSSFDARNEQADLRTTLYWNPRLFTTPQKNKLRFSFYNNDVSKSYRVVVEGMTKDGQLAHYEEVIE